MILMSQSRVVFNLRSVYFRIDRSSLNTKFRGYYYHLSQGREREKGNRAKMHINLTAKPLVIA
jgi:hypothetical protein